jgi:hypothetical protein
VQHPGSISRASPEGKKSERVDPLASLAPSTTTRLVVRKGCNVLLFIGTSVIPGGYSYQTICLSNNKQTAWYDS